MIIVYNNNLINITDDLKRSGLDESLAPIFTRFIVGEVKNVFFRNNTLCRTTTPADAGDNEMRRRDTKSMSRPIERTIAANVVSCWAPTMTEYFLDSRRLDNTTNRDSHSIKNWNGVRQVPKSQTQERGWDYETTYLTNKFMRLINPELAELADAGFTMELTDWMSDDFFLKMVNKRKCIKEKLM